MTLRTTALTGLLAVAVSTPALRADGDNPHARNAVYEVTVTNVNTLNRKGKTRRNRRNNTLGKRADTKRAIVTLAEGDSIEIFET